MLDNDNVRNDSAHDDALRFSQQALALTVLLSDESSYTTITPKIRSSAFWLLMDRLRDLEKAIERIPHV